MRGGILIPKKTFNLTFHILLGIVSDLLFAVGSAVIFLAFLV
jgi:hypothetical protein